MGMEQTLRVMVDMHNRSKPIPGNANPNKLKQAGKRNRTQSGFEKDGTQNRATKRTTVKKTIRFGRTQRSGSPRLSRVLDDFAAEVIACLAKTVISADLRINIVLEVRGAGDSAFPDQRLAAAWNQHFHLRIQIDAEFRRTVIVVHITGIVAAHRGRNIGEADIKDAVGLLHRNKLEGIVALEACGDLVAGKFREERFARIVADRADGDRFDLRMHHGPHVVAAAKKRGEHTAENDGAKGRKTPEETEISTLHRNRPFLHKFRGNPS